jgi:hypothetical protein
LQFKCSDSFLLRYVKLTQYDEGNGQTAYSYVIYGLLFLSTLMSASSGCANDYLSKASSASLHALNMWMYASGFIANTLYYIILTWINPDEPGFFEGYAGWGFGVIVCNSIIGLAITAVYKVELY